LSRSDDTRPVDQGEARKYLSKALDFNETARLALRDQRWNSAGLAAVHAGISAADAAIVASAGRRSSSKDHGAAVDLMRSAVPEAGASQERQLTGLLGMKNTIEYEQRLVAETEAQAMVEQAARLVRWAATVVTAHLD
jgi:HEPN domain-containing protein